MKKPSFALFRKTHAEQEISSPAAQLPVELVHAILDFVSQPTVLSVAAVSRKLRTAALLHKNYYLSVPLFRCSVQHPTTRFADALVALERATRTGVRVALVIYFYRQRTGPGVLGWRDKRDAKRVEAMLRALGESLSACVVKLTMTSHDFSSAEFVRVLRIPAPHLTVLNLIYYVPIPSPQMEPDGAFRCANLPEDIFSGHAPRLRSIALYRVALPATPADAFASVTDAGISSLHGRVLHVAAQLPRLRTLEYYMWQTRPGAGGPILIDFDGAKDIRRLQLSFSNNWVYETADLPLRLPDVSDIDIRGFRHAALDSYWRSFEPPCSLTVTNVMLYPSDREMRLEFEYSGRRICVDEVLDVKPPSAVFDCVTCLTLGQSVIGAFLDRYPLPPELCALSSLTIMPITLTTPIWHTCSTEHPVSCPLLRDIAVVFIPPPGSAQRIEISDHDVNALAECFIPPTSGTVTFHTRGMAWIGDGALRAYSNIDIIAD